MNVGQHQDGPEVRRRGHRTQQLSATDPHLAPATHEEGDVGAEAGPEILELLRGERAIEQEGEPSEGRGGVRRTSAQPRPGRDLLPQPDPKSRRTGQVGHQELRRPDREVFSRRAEIEGRGDDLQPDSGMRLEREVDPIGEGDRLEHRHQRVVAVGTSPESLGARD